MLDRETLADREAKYPRRSNKLGSRRFYHHNHPNQHQQQLIKVCAPPSLTTGSKRNNSIISLVSSNNTDAILIEAQDSQLVSQPPKSSTTNTTSLLESLKNKPLYNLNKTTVPDSTSLLKLSQRRQRFFNPNLTTKQEPVNPKAIIDNYPRFSRNSSQVITYKNIMTSIKMNPIYYLTALFLALCALSTTVQFASADSSLDSILAKMKISPDIINIPSGISTIKVELNNNAVKPGDPIPAKNFKDLNLAKIHWDVSNFDARHTLLLLDIDRSHSGNNTNSIYNQFTSLNIPGNLINAGQAVVGFDPPIVPCQPSSKHRILMLAFHQKQNIDIQHVADISAPSGHSPKRENFKLNDFINKHRLDLVAANLFFAIGETNGVCSASVTLHSLQSALPSIMIAMVTAIITLASASYSRSLVN